MGRTKESQFVEGRERLNVCVCAQPSTKSTFDKKSSRQHIWGEILVTKHLSYSALPHCIPCHGAANFRLHHRAQITSGPLGVNNAIAMYEQEGTGKVNQSHLALLTLGAARG